MKLLLAGLALLPLALLAGARTDGAPPPDDPPPIDCPLCGGNVQMHALIVGALTSANAEAGRRVLVAIWQ